MKRTTTLFLCALLYALFNYAQDRNLELANSWLTQHTAWNTKNISEFNLYFRHKGPSGETLRFQQTLSGIPVYDSEIAIHISPNNQVTYFTTTLKKEIKNVVTTPKISSEKALLLSKNAIKASGLISYQDAKLMVLNQDNTTQLIYKVVLEPNDLPIGSWEVLVNAKDGTIISAKDKAVYHDNKHRKKKAKNTTAVRATGSGFVFDPDPLSAAGVAYGGNYVDGNDATNAQLDAARSNVTLLDITFSGGMYSLVGPYAEVMDFESPNEGLFAQASNVFNFNRQQQGFEAVNVYYHVDHSMRYINETLGITLTPLVYSSGVRFDPHGLNGADNSYYLGGSNRIAFGEGCVDDAEDADVVIHELGHGIHDWITGGNLSQVNGLSEGCGDYWAQSYSRSLGQWSSGDPQYNYMFDWDGHNVCWGGRITNYGATYPGGLVGQVHTDGQMWASVLMEIYDIIGRTKTDAAFLEGLAMTGSSTNQQDAAIAVRQAAVDMVVAGRYGFTCTDVDVIEARFAARGYTLPTVDCEALSIPDEELKTLTIYPNPTNGIVNFDGLQHTYNAGLYNITGQKILDTTLSPTANYLDIQTLAAGIYFLKFDGTNTTLKIIKE